MDEHKAKLLSQKIKAAILMLKQIDTELDDFLGIKETEEIYTVEETFIGDDGKEYSKGNPYIKSKKWYCCGKPLEKTDNTFHCSVCNSKYSA